MTFYEFKELTSALLLSREKDETTQGESEGDSDAKKGKKERVSREQGEHHESGHPCLNHFRSRRILYRLLRRKSTQIILNSKFQSTLDWNI
jgi:hypothetical protein